MMMRTDICTGIVQVTDSLTHAMAFTHHAHLLRQRRAAPRPREHRDRGRCARPSPPAARRGRAWTGTDEHGEPVALAAEREGVTPQELADRNAERFRALMPLADVSNDFFIRTTDEGHKVRVQEVLQRVHDNGHVYKGTRRAARPWCADFKTGNEIGPDDTCPIQPDPPALGGGGELALGLELPASPAPSTSSPTSCSRASATTRRSRSSPAGSMMCRCRARSSPGASPCRGIRSTRSPMSRSCVGPASYTCRSSQRRMDSHLTDLVLRRSFTSSKSRSSFPHAVLLVHEAARRRHRRRAAGCSRRSHGFLLMRDASGRDFKMSKSLGNVLDPFQGHRAVRDRRPALLRPARGLLRSGRRVRPRASRRVTRASWPTSWGNLASHTTLMAARYLDGTVPAVELDAGSRRRARADPRRGRGAPHRRAHGRARGRMARRTRPNRYVEEQAPWSLAKAGDDEAVARVLATLVEGLRVVAVLLHPWSAGLDGEDPRRTRRAGPGLRGRRTGGRDGADLLFERSAAVPQARVVVVDSHTRSAFAKASDEELVGAAREAVLPGCSPSASTRRAARRRSTPAGASRTSGLRSGVTPTRRRGSPTPTSTSCASSRSTRAARRSARPGWTHAGEGAPRRTRSARSRRRSSSRARPPSRWSSTPARPRTRRSSCCPPTRTAST